MKRTPEEVIASALANLRMARTATLAAAKEAYSNDDLNKARELTGKFDGLDEAINLLTTESETL